MRNERSKTPIITLQKLESIYIKNDTVDEITNLENRTISLNKSQGLDY